MLVSVVSPLVDSQALLMLTDQRMYVQMLQKIDSTPVRIFELSRLRGLYERTHKLMPNGIEMVFDDDRSCEFLHIHTRTHTHTHAHLDIVSVYIVFEQPEKREEMLNIIRSITDSAQLTVLNSIDELQRRWQNMELSNFDYLLSLNRMAGRSLADFSAYPVFPWIIADYTSTNLDLTDPASFRDLSKPVGALNPECLSALLRRYKEMPKPRFLYGTHYSTPGYVVFFKVQQRRPQSILPF